MTKDSSYHDYIVYDILGDVPNITSKAMFGGWGLYKDGKIFGIIADGELYFKVGESNRKNFEELGSHSFVYAKKDGKEYSMSYWLVPEEVLEDKEKLFEFVERSAELSK